MNEKKILDPCCGSRMFYFDKKNPLVAFGDIRGGVDTTLCDGRRLEIKPDFICDCRNLPFDDGRFPLVIFDPPHLRKAGDTSWLAQKYGVLPSDGWKEYLGQCFRECWRVLSENGTLIFKWNEEQIKVNDVLKCFPEKPIIGTPRGKTIFLVFFKNRNNEND